MRDAGGTLITTAHRLHIPTTVEKSRQEYKHLERQSIMRRRVPTDLLDAVQREVGPMAQPCSRAAGGAAGLSNARAAREEAEDAQLDGMFGAAQAPAARQSVTFCV